MNSDFFTGILWLSLGYLGYASAAVIVLFLIYLLINKKMPYLAINLGFFTILIAIYVLLIYGYFYYDYLTTYGQSTLNFFDTSTLLNTIGSITFFFLNAPTILLLLIITIHNIFFETKKFQKNLMLLKIAVIMGCISLEGFIFGELLQYIILISK